MTSRVVGGSSQTLTDSLDVPQDNGVKITENFINFMLYFRVTLFKTALRLTSSIEFELTSVVTLKSSVANGRNE